MILTEQFLIAQNACQEGIAYATAKNYIGLEYSQVVRNSLLDEQRDFAGWLIEQKQTEHYVRENGEVVTMGTYQVFNPLTGLHNQFQDEASARQEMISIAYQLLEHTKITLVQEISNENGDATWIPISLTLPLTIS
jgi:hypothetical protein